MAVKILNAEQKSGNFCHLSVKIYTMCPHLILVTDSGELSVDYLEDPLAQRWQENLERVFKTLSVTHEYPDLEDTDETGPGVMVVQATKDTVGHLASKMDSNPFSDLEEPHYMHDDPAEVYEIFQEIGTEDNDGALAVMGNGVVLESNVLLEPPRETYHGETEHNPEHGAKHMWGARASVDDDIAYSVALSSKNGKITTFTDGTQAEAPERRADLIKEVKEGEADWMIDEAMDDWEQYDWLESPEGYSEDISEKA
jgi:hypothetical protein